MESDDDMHDANDLASAEEEDDYYSGGEEEVDDYNYSYDQVQDENEEYTEDFEFMANEYDDLPVSRLQKNYTILTDEDIRQRQEEDITRISTVLSISRDGACILLRRYKWTVNDVHEEWFADEERVRKAVGLLEKPLVKFSSAKEVTCGICFENYSLDRICTAACGHPFCGACWKAYISTSINDGPGCLTLRCPDPSCGAAVGQDMINILVPDGDKEKYRRYLLRSYVEDSRKTKWCPAPGCDCAVEYIIGSGSYDVTCSCSYSFCWSCTEEAHRPVDCETVAKWILKNSAESENMNWISECSTNDVCSRRGFFYEIGDIMSRCPLDTILANSKPCPKCKRPIEKHQGCMHMTCTPPCKFEFCWLCLGAWSDHGERTGGFYACNRYEAAKQEGVYDEAERRREMAKNSLERYTHYYERWASNQSSRQKASVDLHQMQSVHLDKLSEVQSQPEAQMKFIIEAWQQIVECRRVLKWTYAYGYYLPEHEHTKKQFFEYLQGEAEAGLERLHQCAEKELQNYLNAEGPSKDFNDFRTKLAGLTSVTRNYFENLVRALENGLSDVDPQGSCSKTPSSKIVAGSSKAKGGRARGSSRTGALSRNTDDSSSWACDQCTLLNSRSSTTCHVCHYRRKDRP